MKRYEGNEIGKKLKELMQLHQVDQPIISIWCKGGPGSLERLRIKPDHCKIKEDGKTIQIGVKRLAFGLDQTISYFYWTKDEPNDINLHITLLVI